MDGKGSKPLSSSTKGTSLHDRIASIYYKHGLFCASHPYPVILLTIAIASGCCYPLLHQPIIGNLSQTFSAPLENIYSTRNQADNIQTPRWLQAAPVSYIQQVVIKSSVSPWQNDLLVTDAFRAPLAEIFQIVETIANHQYLDPEKGLISLNHLCLQVEETLDKSIKSFLPMYGCLMISPAAIWKQNINRFKEDGNILKSVFERRSTHSDPSSLREILFGVPWTETGIKKFLVRTRQRVLTFAVTIVYSSLNLNYTSSLKNHLHVKYPSSVIPQNSSDQSTENEVAHIYFEDHYTLAEFIPLGVTYIILFLYIYFSVRKIDLVKYKWALAISAVFTVMMSLMMSVGLCIWFGLNPTINGSLSFSEILPYLVVIIGLENMLVLTKSVVSTSSHLDVKLRVAQGLSKEGWSITKNLFMELALLAFSFFTFVPAIQKFCLFAVVGLLSDFFLQMVFFLTVLSIDIRRLEVTDCPKHSLKKSSSNVGSLNENDPDGLMDDNELSGPVIRRSRSGLTRMRAPVVPYNTTPYSTSVFAPPTTPILAKLPKRLRFFHFWARTRMVQRGLMLLLVSWIIILVYNSGLVEHLKTNSTGVAPQITQQVRPFLQAIFGSNHSEDSQSLFFSGQQSDVDADMDAKLHHNSLNLWQQLPTQHWTTLFGFYNISLLGRYVTILPAIHLSIPVSPLVAIQLRHPAETDPTLRAYLKTYLDKLQDDESKDETAGSVHFLPLLDYRPASKPEIFLGIALALPTFIFLIYLMVVLYRCICPRHYAEWRSSWRRKVSYDQALPSSDLDPDTYLIMETLPIRLKGHTHDIEDVVSDENLVCSVCLKGDVRVWDAMSGECITVIARTNRTIQEESSPVSNIELHRKQLTETKAGEFSWSPCDYDFSSPLYHQNPWTSDSGMSSPSIGSNGDSLNASVDSWSSHMVRDGEGIPGQRYRLENLVFSSLSFQPVWCITAKGAWLLLGCGGGRVELWDILVGSLLNVYDYSSVGVTSLHLERNRLYVARMNGVVEFLLVDMVEPSPDEELGSGMNESGSVERLQIVWLHSLRAHTSPITVLKVMGGHIITGSQDHLMKVFYCDTGTLIYTLHGHSGALSALHVDQLNASFAASGCQEGMICVWDLLTGTCVYSLQAHQGSVSSLTTNATYLISLGTNDFICIWEKNQGHLIHSLRQHSLSNDIALLTSNIMVSANQNRLVLWDINYGDALRVVNIDMDDHVSISHLRLIGRAIVCSYGNELCVVHFPAMTEKGE